ncbi:MAG: amidase [Alphaproteobacteria bacterium]|nr:amidase [Alphaproteobacteria bacterium]
MAETAASPNVSTNYVQSPGGIADLAAQIRAGAITPAQLLQRYLDRIAASDSAVEAWLSVDGDGAMATAETLGAEAAAGEFRGPLHGIPIGIKDIIDVAGWPTKCNSATRRNASPATADAEIIAALRTAGAIILGKCHTTEFAYFSPSPARNPHNINHTPGGSSSGPAAAVASGTVPGALGTQTVASVNRPAAYCGIGAFKPSTGAGTGYGVTALAPMFDTVGFYGWSVADAVALFEAVCPAYLEPPTVGDDAVLRVVVLEDALFDEADPAILAAREAAAKLMASAGHEVVHLHSPVPLKSLGQTQMHATEYELARVHAGLRDHPAEDVSVKLREAIERGGDISEADYLADRRDIDGARAAFFADLAATDAVMVPATPKTAPEGIAATGDPRFIGPWTALGGPVVSLPAGADDAGLPIGCMLAGRPGEDRAFARLACRLAEAVNLAN